MFSQKAAIKHKLMPFLKEGLLFCFMTAFLMTAPSIAAKDAPLLIAEDDGKYRLQYNLNIPEKSDFWINVRDMIRAGKVVRIMHRVDMRHADSFFWGGVAHGVFEKYVQYNLFEDTYAYGRTPKKSRRSGQLSDVKGFLFSLDAPDFLPKKKIETANAYSIQITLRLGDNEKIGVLSMLQGFFSPKWTKEFSHVAR